MGSKKDTREMVHFEDKRMFDIKIDASQKTDSFYEDAIIEFRYKMNEAIEEFERKIASKENKPSEKFEGLLSKRNE